MTIETFSPPIIDRIIHNLYLVREELARINLDPARSSQNVPIYIVCRERMRMVQEDMRQLRKAIKIDDQLTAMGVIE